jgi:hypothetical protein
VASAHFPGGGYPALGRWLACELHGRRGRLLMDSTPSTGNRKVIAAMIGISLPHQWHRLPAAIRTPTLRVSRPNQ